MFSAKLNCSVKDRASPKSFIMMLLQLHISQGIRTSVLPLSSYNSTHISFSPIGYPLFTHLLRDSTSGSLPCPRLLRLSGRQQMQGKSSLALLTGSPISAVVGNKVVAIVPGPRLQRWPLWGRASPVGSPNGYKRGRRGHEDITNRKGQDLPLSWMRLGAGLE